jgi:succinate dehydrogenase (ubiquinone) cytochrome b560 subunit
MMLARLSTKNALRFSITSSSRSLSVTPIKTNEKIAMTAQEELDKWNANNKKFNRPLSPHLSIYEWSLPMTMSAFYRIFAVGLGFAFLLAPMPFVLGKIGITLPVVGLFDPAIGNSLLTFSETCRNGGLMSTLGLSALKASFIFPLTFHLVNGCRHLGWDMKAYGIRHLKDVYTSGNIVLVTTALVTLALVAMHSSN